MTIKQRQLSPEISRRNGPHQIRRNVPEYRFTAEVAFELGHIHRHDNFHCESMTWCRQYRHLVIINVYEYWKIGRSKILPNVRSCHESITIAR